MNIDPNEKMIKKVRRYCISYTTFYSYITFHYYILKSVTVTVSVSDVSITTALLAV
jgi:hypothetical protein